MKAVDIIEGLLIIEKSKPKHSDNFHVRAEHDMIIAGSLEWDMPDSEQARLFALGWLKNEDFGGWYCNV